MRSVHLKLVAVMFFWGIAFVSGRTLGQSYHPFTIAFVRFLFASAFLWPIFIMREKESLKINVNQIGSFSLLGLTGVFAYNFCFFYGLKTVEAGRASVIIAINPLVTSLASALFLKESLTQKKILGMLLALFGVCYVISRGDFSFFLNHQFDFGELYLIAAVFSWVTYTLIGKFLIKSSSPLKATTWATTLGMIFLLPFAYVNGLENFFISSTWMDWIHILNLGIFSTCIGFIWYYQGVKEIGPTETSSYINLIPVFGTACGVLFLNEHLEVSLIIGAIFVISGVMLVNFFSK